MTQETLLGKYFKKCTICENDYNIYEGEICPSCAELKELEFIKLTLISKPALNVLTLSQETGIPTSRILRYIQEKHIITSQN